MAITTSSRFTRVQLNYTNSIIDLLVQTTDDKARVELGESITVGVNESNGRMPFKVIAEDDTEQVYAINVTRI